MNKQEWMASFSQQLGVVSASDCRVGREDLPSVFAPVFSDDGHKPADYYRRSPVQQALFDLDPENDTARTAYFSHFSKPIADFFAKQIARRIKTYGTQYATAWFKAQQAEQIHRFRLVMKQYADILSVMEMPHHNLEWVDDLPIKRDNWTTPEFERDIELEERKSRKVAEMSALLPSLSERFKRQRQQFKQQNLRPLCYLSKQQIVYLADCICEKINDTAHRRAEQLSHLANDRKGAKAALLEIYGELIRICNEFHITAPYEAKANKGVISDKNLQSGFLKLADPKFWTRKLSAMAKKQKEHLSIAVGMVHAVSGGYVSCERLKEYEQQRRANYEFIKSCVIVNLLNPEEQHELLDIWLKTNANPKITRIELMTRLKGYEEWAEHHGLDGVFVTLTAPSKYHAMLKQGGINPKWNGSSPQQTMAYLNRVWANIRASLARQGIQPLGIRVAEPHHDATPHCHFVLFGTPAQLKAIKRAFYRYALAEDGNEKGAKLRRCRFMKVDKTKGSATAYLAKYVSKNIDGQAMKDLFSDETSRPVSESAVRAKAWATLWRIRQFQFVGGANIGSWRELRRLGSVRQEDETIDIGRAICDTGDFAAYLDYQGGGFVKRKDQKIRLAYIETEPNKYLETRQKVIGVLNSATAAITKTRLKQWAIGKKRRVAAHQGERSEPHTAGGSPALGLVSVTVRSTGNRQISPTVRKIITEQVKTQKGRVTEQEIDDLLNGKRLHLGIFGGVALSLRYANGHLLEEKQDIKNKF